MATETCPDVWRLHLRGVNSYLVDADVLTLIDAGWKWSGDRLLNEINGAGYGADDIERILLTHFDPDHTGSLPRVAETEGEVINKGTAVYGGEEDLDVYLGETKPSTKKIKGLLQRLALEFQDTADTVYHSFEERVEIEEFTAIPTPGHTPGHVTYLHEPTGTAFVGDLMDGDGEPLTGFMNYDTKQVEESIENLRQTTEYDRVCPGHGTPFEV
ncbi:MAG: MBL fold metallo-hydrolase [Halobacteria archaeon]